MSEDYLTVALKPDTLRPVLINKGELVSNEAIDGAQIRFNPAKPIDIKYAKVEDSLVITRLPVSAIIPEKRIGAWSCGKQEEYLVSQALSNPEDLPEVPTIAIWANVKGWQFSYELLYCGQDLEIVFPMSRWLDVAGKEEADSDTLISILQAAAGIKFRRKSCVSEWTLFQDKYRGMICSQGENIKWEEGPLIYVRFKAQANLVSVEPDKQGLLILESIILPTDSPFESLPSPKKEALNKASAITFTLW